MNTGITFIMDENINRIYHTHYDFDLKQLADLTITPPEAKRHLIEDVLGIDGNIDITTHFGPVRFANRTITAVFEAQDQSYDEWCEICSRIYNSLHGKMASRIIMDIDPEYYWSGWVTVTAVKEAIVYSEIKISMEVYPYKIRKDDFIMKAEVSDSSITIRNERMPSTPKIVSDSSLVLYVNGKSYEIVEGENLPDFELYEGENTLTFEGTGTITIQWTGGSL